MPFNKTKKVSYPARAEGLVNMKTKKVLLIIQMVLNFPDIFDKH